MAAMCELARLSDFAANVLRQYADAPGVCSVTCSPGSVIGRASVSMQLSSCDDVAEMCTVAEWAVAWDSPVLFKAATSAPGSVRIATRIEAVTVDGPVNVEVWTYVEESSVALVGVELAAGVEVPVVADVVLSRLDDTVSDACRAV